MSAATKKKNPVRPAAPSKAIRADVAPHSWYVSRWTEHAPGVVPNTTAAARHLVRCHRDELTAAGALTRVGRELVIMGAPYSAWLVKQRGRVADYELKMNAKHGNGANSAEAVQP
jgi:hypothetical protein